MPFCAISITTVQGVPSERKHHHHRGWYDAETGGTLVSTDNPATVTLTSDTVIAARFEQMLIVFSIDDDGHYSDTEDDQDIYTIFPDGTGLSQLTDNSVQDKDPCWSPDKSRIAFSWRDGGGRQ